MTAKTKITITVDKELFEAFKFVLPEYMTVSGVIETLIKEFMIGHYKQGWSLGEMVDVLRGRTTLEGLEKATELGLRGRAGVESEEDLRLRRAIRKGPVR